MDTAVDAKTVGVSADITVYKIRKIKRQGTFGEIIDIATWRIDKNTVAKQIDIQLVLWDFGARCQTGGYFLQLADPL